MLNRTKTKEAIMNTKFLPVCVMQFTQINKNSAFSGYSFINTEQKAEIKFAQFEPNRCWIFKTSTNK